MVVDFFNRRQETNVSALGKAPKVQQQPGDSRSSAAQNTAVGSGARPGAGKTETMVSSPSNKRTLDRDPPAGWLGSGSKAAPQ